MLSSKKQVQAIASWFQGLENDVIGKETMIL